MEQTLMTDIATQLSEYICKEALRRPNYNLGIDDALISSGLIDSFHLVDLAVFVEEQFGVHMDDTELNASAFDSVAQLSALIQQRIK